MGQEISQQNQCSSSIVNNTRRPQPSAPFPIQPKPNYYDANLKEKQQQQNQSQSQQQQFPHYQKSTDYTSSSSGSKKHKELIYTASSSSSNASSSTTDDEFYRQRQKYNLTKQTYEKKISKQLALSRKSLDSNSSTATTTTSASDYHNSVYGQADELYRNIKLGGTTEKNKHQRKLSQSTDSGIYYSSCHCAPARFSSTASINSGGGTSLVSTKSNKSIQKQKAYLDHQLYIKSYLDILEEDEKARAQYKIATPGGIRNYTPKILSEVPLARNNLKLKSKFNKDDPWI